jgi:hypothetical protein
MSVSSDKTYYEILGVAPDATVDEITNAYRVLVRRYADDKPRFDSVTEAYMALADPTARREYDDGLARGGSATTRAPQTVMQRPQSQPEGESECPSCGSRNAEANHFCGVCGLVLREPSGGAGGRPKLGIGVLHLPGGDTVTLEHGEVVIGRASRCSVVITDDPYVSSEHARIHCLMGIFTVQDLGSTNGSKLNGERLAEGESVKLQDGDVLTVGKTDLRFEIR